LPITKEVVNICLYFIIYKYFAHNNHNEEGVMEELLTKKKHALHEANIEDDATHNYDIVTNTDNLKFMVIIHEQNADTTNVDVIYENGDLNIEYADGKSLVLPGFPKEKLKQAVRENGMLIAEINEEGIHNAYIIKFN
jgi:hypothetical protein